MQHTTGESRTNPSVKFSYGPFHMDMQVLADQELTNNSSERTQDVV